MEYKVMKTGELNIAQLEDIRESRPLAFEQM